MLVKTFVLFMTLVVESDGGRKMQIAISNIKNIKSIENCIFLGGEFIESNKNIGNDYYRAKPKAHCVEVSK